jgi:Na+/glutamate symporter
MKNASQFQTIAIVACFVGFILGLFIGAHLGHLLLKANFMDEMETENEEIWLRIHQIDGSRQDLFQKIDSLAMDIEAYNMELLRMRIIENGEVELDVGFR